MKLSSFFKSLEFCYFIKKLQEENLLLHKRYDIWIGPKEGSQLLEIHLFPKYLFIYFFFFLNIITIFHDKWPTLITSQVAPDKNFSSSSNLK